MTEATRLAASAKVLVICDPHDRESGEVVVRQLNELGYATKLVLTPGEALWHLEDSDHTFHAVVIDGDRALADRFELLSHLRERHPAMIRLLLLTSPSTLEFEDCEVVDKQGQREALSSALARFIGPS